MPTVLLTGANRGIGLAFAETFARDGWTLHACCRHPEKAKALQALAGTVNLHRLDVTDGLQVASLARELLGEPIDLLINNAGVYGPRTGFGETDHDDWLDVLKVNTVAPLRIVERFVEHVAESDRKLIVNISSVLGSIAENSAGGSYIYRSSKAALNMVVKGLSVDLAERGITVIAVHPGWVRTDMGGQEAAVTPDDSVAGMRALIDRAGPEDNGKFFNHLGNLLPW